MVIALWAIVVGGALLCLGALVAWRLAIAEYGGAGANVVIAVSLCVMAGGAAIEMVAAVVVLILM